MKRALAAAALLAPSLCLAGGTVDFRDVEPLLRQKPALRTALLAAFDLGPTVMAAVRFGPHYQFLGGERMGPYMIQARAKRTKAPLEVVLCTAARFLDEAGNAAIDEISAERVEETLTAVLLREPGATPGIPICPER